MTDVSETEQRVAAYYTTAALVERILAGVEAAGGRRDALSAEQLKGVDEFHTGGLEATEALLEQLEIDPATRVLDIGCGLGGTARHIALRSGARVTGVDLTQAYVEAARELSALVGLHQLTHFHQGSAVALPVDDAAFDLATLFHVGMNITDKAALMAEAARVVAPGGTFAVFDVMRLGEGEIAFPVPWAEHSGLSFVDSPEVYRNAAAGAGLTLRAERARGDFALAFFERVFAAAAERGGPAPVGIHLLMRDTAGQKLSNYVDAVRAGSIAPVEMIFTRD